MPKTRYHIYIDEAQSFDADLDTTLPIYRLIDDLAAKHNLPLANGNDTLPAYALFGGSERRRLSGEQTLEQASYVGGGDLYLAPAREPWWVLVLRDGTATRKQLIQRLAIRWLIPIIVVMLVAGSALAATSLAKRLINPPVVSPTPAASVSSDSTPLVPPTVTLIPQQTISVIQPSPEMTPDSTVTAVPPAVVYTVQGVRSEYYNRDTELFLKSSRIFGAHLWKEPQLQTSIPATDGFVLISNGDELEILDKSVAGVYQVRVLKNQLDPRDEKVINAIGWIKRWLVDNVDVPPAPPTATPILFRAFRPEVIRNYPGTGPGQPNQRQSCVSGRVVDRRNNGIANAVLYVNNGAPAAANLLFETNGQGNYYHCGLGDSSWSVVLTFIPGQPRIAGEATGVFYVNGSQGQEAIVNFRER
jgi:hypothetical protein